MLILVRNDCERAAAFFTCKQPLGHADMDPDLVWRPSGPEGEIGDFEAELSWYEASIDAGIAEGHA